MCFFELSMCSIRSSIPDFVSKFQFFYILNSLRKLILHFLLFYPHFFNFSCFNFNWIFESLHISEIIHFWNVSVVLLFFNFIHSFIFKIFPFYPHFQFPDFPFYPHIRSRFFHFIHILKSQNFPFYPHFQFLDFSILSTFSISSYLNQIEPLFLIDPGSE